MDKKALYNKHLMLVQEYNKRTNLTRISTFEEGVLLHVEDSLSACAEFDSCTKGKYADLGSGAGFPGIPLSIYSGRDTTLVESVKKKALCLQKIIEELGLSNVDVFAGRIEQLALDEPEGYSVLTARALAQLSILMELASPLLSVGGTLICYKATVSDEEYQHAYRLQKKFGMEIATTRKFTLSDKKTNRTIITIKKTGKSTIRLPRRDGMAQRKPF